MDFLSGIGGGGGGGGGPTSSASAETNLSGSDVFNTGTGGETVALIVLAVIAIVAVLFAFKKS